MSPSPRPGAEIVRGFLGHGADSLVVEELGRALLDALRLDNDEHEDGPLRGRRRELAGRIARLTLTSHGADALDPIAFDAVIGDLEPLATLGLAAACSVQLERAARAAGASRLLRAFDPDLDVARLVETLKAEIGA